LALPPEQNPAEASDPCEAERQVNKALTSSHHVIDPVLSEHDSLQPFLDDCCELHPLAWCRIRDLWQIYEQWTASTQKRVPLSRRGFAAQIQACGCRADRTSTARIWRGIRLVDKTL
jgi:phage/plasmid-associated DNA primase